MNHGHYCSKNCLYLKQVTDQSKLPYYCDLFQVFLGVDKNDILRTDTCLGKRIDAKTSGYHLISSYTDRSISKQKTKWGFFRLGSVLQNQFVSILKKDGNNIGVSNKFPLNKDLITQELSTQIKENSISKIVEGEKTPFQILLGSLAESFPALLNSTNQQLLSNLFVVLDATEQSMLETILNNKDSAKTFLKTFNDMPKTENLLKDLRRQVDVFFAEHADEDDENETEQFKLEMLKQRMHYTHQR